MLSPAQKVAKKDDERTAKKATNHAMLHNSWYPIDMKTNHYQFDALPRNLSFATIAFRRLFFFYYDSIFGTAHHRRNSNRAVGSQRQK